MDVVSACALPVGSLLWQPRPGAFALTIVCKATFSLEPVESPLAAEQEAVEAFDAHWNDDAWRSLSTPGDLAPAKPRAEVMLVGHAFAPDRLPARMIVARLVVAGVDKSIEVYCDRAFGHDGELREEMRFLHMPLVYERAAGGPDTVNPVGMRPDGWDPYGKLPVPNLQLPAGHGVENAATPVGFGPIAPSWPSRRERLGRLAATWSQEAWPAQPLGDDFDLAFFNAAPVDQQTEALVEDEQIILENLHPAHPRLVTNLPGLVPSATLEGRAGGPQPVPLVCDTLFIDTDRALCTMTWRGRIALAHQREAGRVVVTLDPAAQKGRTPEEEAARARLAETRITEGMGTLSEPLASATAPALPFAPALPRGTAKYAGAAQALDGDDDADELAPVTPVKRAPIPRPTPVAPPAPTRASEPPFDAEERSVVRLVGFDPAAVAGIRAAWPIARGAPAGDARAMLVILAGGAPAGPEALAAALERAVGERGELAPPLVLVAGELLLPFDEIERLRAILVVATPIAAGDAPLQEAVDAGLRLLDLPWLVRAGGAAEVLAGRIRAAVAEGRRAISLDSLDEQVERILFEGRRFQLRIVQGRPAIRALLRVPGAVEAIPAYVPESIGEKLPMARRLRVRLIAELDLREDHAEPHPAALRVVALARLAALPRIR